MVSVVSVTEAFPERNTNRKSREDMRDPQPSASPRVYFDDLRTGIIFLVYWIVFSFCMWLEQEGERRRKRKINESRLLLQLAIFCRKCFVGFRFL